MSPRPTRTLALLALAVLAACKAPPLPEPTDPDRATDFSVAPDLAVERLGPGDVLAVRVLGHAELSASRAPLDAAGRLRLPLVGAVDLTDASLDDAEARLEEALAVYVREPDVTLVLLEPRGMRYFVFGAVRTPGRFPLDAPLNAYQALALAGGVLDGGDRANVCLLRAREDFLDVHVFDARTPDASGLVPVHPDDLLFVRLTGSGRFREQVLPVLQGISPAVSSLVNLGLVADAIDE